MDTTFFTRPFFTRSRSLNTRYCKVGALYFYFECICLMIARCFKGRSPVTKRSVIKEAWQIGMRDGICFKVLHTRTFIFFSSSFLFFKLDPFVRVARSNFQGSLLRKMIKVVDSPTTIYDSKETDDEGAFCEL